MKACLLRSPAPIESRPLDFTDVPVPEPAPNEVLVRVSTCAVCRTDLHVVEGELPSRKSPVIPGHQIVGVIEKLGQGSTRFRIGDRVGIAWLHSTCGVCEFCRSGRENLCERAAFTGYTVDGGYAQYALGIAGFHLSHSRRISPTIRPRRCFAPESSASGACAFLASDKAASLVFMGLEQPRTWPFKWHATGELMCTPAPAMRAIKSWRSSSARNGLAARSRSRP